MKKNYYASGRNNYYKYQIFLFTAVLILLNSTAFSQCTTGAQYGSSFTPAYTGNIELIQNSLTSGTYNIVNVMPNKYYTFITTSSTSSNTYAGYITITDATGTIVYANGNAPLQWSSGTVTGATRFYVHNNASCSASGNFSKSLITANASCMAPLALNVTNTNSTGATLNWTSPASVPDFYDYYLSTSATMPQNTQQQLSTGQVDSSVTSITKNDLLPGTTYHWWVRSTCNHIHAVWISGGTFSTPAATCGLPTDLMPSNWTTSSATISWTAPTSAPANGYEYYLSTTNVTPTVAAGTPITAVTKNLTGLVINTTYFWWVRSICSSTVHSQWVQGAAFLTGSGFNCTSSPYGMRPSTVFTPSCMGTPEIISNSAWAGEYCNVNILPNKNYTFASSVSSDYITITNEEGTVLYASGQTPVTWSSGTNTGVISYYLHGDAACAVQQLFRTKSITCATPGTSICDLPGAPFHTSVTNVNATISWTASATTPANGYQYLYSTDSTSPEASATPSGSTTGLTTIVSGLNPNTTYYYWVRSNCGTTQSQWTGWDSFTTGSTNTSCAQPYGLTASLVNANSAVISWTAPATVPENGYHYYYSGSGSTPDASTTPSGNTTATLVSLIGLISGVTYDYWVRSYCATGAGVWVYGGSFTTTSNSGPCLPPVYPIASNITPTSVKLSWTAPNPPPAFGYDLYINSTGTEPFASQAATSNVNEASGHYYNFSPNHTYFWWVRSFCNDRSDWVYGGTFTTTSLLTCNTADYGLYPDATYVPTCTGTPELVAGNSHAGEFSNVAITANRTYTFESSGSTDYITITNATGTVVYAFGQTPLTWYSATNAGVIRFYLHKNASCDKDAAWRSRLISCTGGVAECAVPTTVSVATITNSGATINWIAPASVPSSGYQYFYNTTGTAPLATNTPSGSTTAATISLSGLNSSTVYYFWVRSNCGTSQSTWISGGSFTTLATSQNCGVPTNPTLNSTTANSASFSFTAPASAPSGGYDFYYDTSNTAPSNGTTPSGNTATVTASLNGLNTNTTYYYWVRSNCGTTQSAWVAGGSFSTSAAAGCNGASYGLYPATTYTPLCSGSVETIATDSWAGEYSKVNILANKQYTFSSSVTSDYITITNSAGTLLYASGQTPLIWSSGTNSGAINYFLHTNAACGDEQAGRVRSITCMQQQSCSAPTALSASAITSSGALLSWTVASSVPANGYQYYYSPSSSDPSEATTQSGATTGNSASVSGLSSSTTYYFWVRSDCGSTQSAWITGGSFTTSGGQTCQPPLGLSVGNITSSSATITWTTQTQVPLYEYYFSTVSTTPLNTATPSGTGAIQSIIASLNSSTVYYYWVRSHCGNIGAYSSWVAGGNFTTLNNADCNGANHGLYPATVFTPLCSGNSEVISYDSWAGEFSKVNISANQQYTFSSSVATDHITITNEDGTTLLTSGNNPLIWSSGTYVGIIRYFLHANAACGDQNVSRTRSITCMGTISSCPSPIAISAIAITGNSLTLSWISASQTPTNGYQYYYSTNSVTPSAATVPSGNTTSLGTVVIGLSNATTYYFWVRSNCGTTQGSWIGGSATTAIGNCVSAPYGQYPLTTFTPAYTGNPETILTDAYAGGYCKINVIPNKQYQFSSSVATDYLTITNDDATIIYANGSTPLTWSSQAVSGSVRFYLHTNAQCGTSQTVRGKYVTCNAALGLEDVSLSNIWIYPNPTNAILNISFSQKIDSVIMSNALGQVVLKTEIGANEGRINIESFASGTYFLKILSGDNKAVFKILKE